MAEPIVHLTPDLPATTDLVVIGGGIVGAATAFFARQAGLRAVVLVKRPALCSLTTPASTGAFRAQFDNAEEIALVREGITLFEHFAEATRLPRYDLGIRKQGYLFATPENLAAISGQLKDFFDRCYYPVLDRINGRPYASLVCAGSDGQNAARQIARIATGWRLKAVAEPLIVCTHAQTPEAILAPKQIGAADLERCRALGEALATGLALGVF